MRGLVKHIINLREYSSHKTRLGVLGKMEKTSFPYGNAQKKVQVLFMEPSPGVVVRTTAFGAHHEPWWLPWCAPLENILWTGLLTWDNSCYKLGI